MKPFKASTLHPYASGNYRSVQIECALQACVYAGILPKELAGGMYVRNGSNPTVDVKAEGAAEERPYHWFDGDGMLHGVFFDTDSQGEIRPSFVNRYVLTDLHLHGSLEPGLSRPVLPSISTLLGSLTQLPAVVYSVMRAVSYVGLSFLNGIPIRRISVSNTSVLWHDGRALVGCESGPLNWVRLPALETVGWWDLDGDRGEIGMREKHGALGWMREWTTAHPKLDPVTGELILFHSTMLPPYLNYSVIPPSTPDASQLPRILGAPVPISGPRMMHDFAASATHSILLDMPLSLDPLNLARGQPVVAFSPNTPSRFGVLPRHQPESVRWYNAPSCIIFHTALAFDTPNTVNLVCCRLNSARLVYAAGNIPFPESQVFQNIEDTCLLYYYQFALDAISTEPEPSHAFPLSVIPFEFPVVPHERSMSDAKYVYGCSMRQGSFSAALGAAAKIDCIVKMDVQTLIARGIANGNKAEEAVDRRTVASILQTDEEGDTISIFSLPPLHYAQEVSFVPRENQTSEDDGYLLTYVFDENQLDSVTGDPIQNAQSELWVIDAKNMKDVIAKVVLPQRVPYGLHGNWFTKEQVEQQREVQEVRQRPILEKKNSGTATVSWLSRLHDGLANLVA